MISTANIQDLPAIASVQQICKATAVLDAIICPDWEYRYYSYDKKWSKTEECFQTNNGEGDEMHILFSKDGCVINGFAHELYDFDAKLPAKEKLTKDLPAVFDSFINGEPVQSIGTTFCIWSTGSEWEQGELEHNEDGSDEMLDIMDGNPQTYIDWASEYFVESYKESGIPLETVTSIYNGETLTKEMVLSIVHDVEDWKQLKKDLKEIGYPHSL